MISTVLGGSLAERAAIVLDEITPLAHPLSELRLARFEHERASAADSTAIDALAIAPYSRNAR